MALLTTATNPVGTGWGERGGGERGRGGRSDKEIGRERQEDGGRGEGGKTRW